MTQPSKMDAEPLSPTLTRQVESVCDSFEAAWRSGLAPAIEELLSSVPQEARRKLLFDLMALELAYRLRRGESPGREEYEQRFPSHVGVVWNAFAAADTWHAGTLPSTVNLRRNSQGTITQVGDYDLLDELGRGGMGVVYRAWQRSLKRHVAVKMIRSGLDASAEEKQRFRREAEAMARLHHPSIVQVHEVGEHEQQPYFVMELVEGRCLTKLLAQEPMSAIESAELVKKLAEAVEVAHQSGIVHRDLKPANILIQKIPEDAPATLIPKITDFGLAKKLDEVGQTASGAILGTPSYLAPEQARGETDKIGPTTDVYALGAILYECLTGRPPFEDTTALKIIDKMLSKDPKPPRQIVRQTPKDLETICLKCLEKSPQRRYQTSQELAGDIDLYLRGMTISARPVGRTVRSWRWVKRHPAISVVVLLALIVAGGLGAWGIYLQSSLDRERESKKDRNDGLGKREDDRGSAPAQNAPKKQIGTLDEAESLLQEILIASPQRRSVKVMELQPTLEDCRSVFVDGFAEAAHRHYDRAWSRGRFRFPTSLSQMRWITVTTEELKSGNNEADVLPGGYKLIASRLKNGITVRHPMFRNASQKSIGALIYVNDNWRWFPDPWEIRR